MNNLRYIFIHKNLVKIFNPKRNFFICLDDAVDTRDFNFKKPKKKIKNTCVYVGSFYPGKGLDLIIKLSSKLKNIRFHLYGDKKFLSNQKLNRNIKIFNFIKYKNIPKVLSRYQIALMPYGNRVSGRLSNINLIDSMSPLKMFDYLASTNIILASDLKVYSHILKHKKNSILLNNAKINLWAKWINSIFKNNYKFNHLKKNALLTSKKYTWLKRADKILRFSNKNFIKLEN